MKLQRPKPFKVTNGVKWFLIEKPAHSPVSPSGSPRKGFEPGIYLDKLK